eukprot:g19655.t1
MLQQERVGTSDTSSNRKSSENDNQKQGPESTQELDEGCCRRRNGLLQARPRSVAKLCMKAYIHGLRSRHNIDPREPEPGMLMQT